MTTELSDDSVPFTEREASEGEIPKGKMLDILADGKLWIFLTADIGDLDGIKLSIEASGEISTETIKALLSKTLEALP